MHILVGKFLAIDWSQSRYSVRKHLNNSVIFYKKSVHKTNWMFSAEVDI